jgi:ribonuclease HII
MTIKHPLKPNFSLSYPEAGCDEAGRGCLAGPVVAAAVILNPDKKIIGLNDSKKLNERQRNELRGEITESALDYAIAFVEAQEIDVINILNASFLAMHLALDMLKNTPAFILVDGNRFKPYKKIPHECIIKGDGKFQSIAAASILAKTARDEFMTEIHYGYPEYHWIQNKGYPTLEHKFAIHKYGYTPYHRKTFSSSIQMKLF